MATIRIRRGTKANLDTILGTVPLLDGEIGYCTDTEEIYVGNGSAHHLIGKAFVQATEPVGIDGRVWHDTDDNSTWVYAEGAWQGIGGDLDAIADGTTYGRVLNTELDNNHVTRLSNHDASSTVTLTDLTTHLADTNSHNDLNDATTSTSTLWSSSKISTEISAVVSGIDPQESVKSQVNFVTTEPNTPAIGDRYINTASGTSSIEGQTVTANYIYEWNGTNWTETPTSEGMFTWVEDEDVAYVFNGSWFVFASSVSHDSLSGLDGAGSNYQHITDAEHTAFGDLIGTANEVGSTYHIHDGRYFTETEIGLDTGATTSGAYLVGLYSTGLTQTIATDLQGAISDLDSAINVLDTGSYSDTDAQDAVGAILTDTTSIDFTYVSATSITADLLVADGGTFV